MKKALLRLIILVLVSGFIPVCVYANTLTLNISTNNEKVEIGNEINVTVSWNQEMQAADFNLNYDSEKLEYVKCNVDDMFVNNEVDNGVLKTAWVSIDDTTKKEIQYTFKVKKSGTATFTTKVYGGFATGELEIPDNYTEGKLEIKIFGNDMIIYVIIGALVIVFIAMILNLIIRKKSKNSNNRRK